MKLTTEVQLLNEQNAIVDSLLGDVQVPVTEITDSMTTEYGGMNCSTMLFKDYAHYWIESKDKDLKDVPCLYLKVIVIFHTQLIICIDCLIRLRLVVCRTGIYSAIVAQLLKSHMNQFNCLPRTG